MSSISIFDLLGIDAAHLQPGIKRDGGSDAATVINRALAHLAGREEHPNGILFLPPGTYRCDTPIVLRSNVELWGAGSDTVLRLGSSVNVDVVTGDNISNVRLRNLRIDGNRANNTGSRNGLWLNQVTDAWLDNVEAVSCRADGFRLDDCERVELAACKASDNGRHGLSLSYCRFCQIVSPRCYDNSQVESAGTGDGINLELLSHDNSILAALCYETAGVGDRQGYPIREAAGEGCYRNVIMGGAGWGNRTSNNPSLDSGDSICLWPGFASIPGGLTITP